MTDYSARTVRLPWPESRLFPNAFRKLFWAKKAEVTKRAREAAHWACIEQNVRDLPGVRLAVTIMFTPPRRPGRRPDRDGMIGAFKSAQDGIADAVGIDDGRWITSYAFAEPEGKGWVEVVLEPLPGVAE